MIDEVDVIIFVVSGCEGIIDVDELVVKILYCSNKLVILVVNKVDNFEMCNDIYEFYVLGLGDFFLVFGSYGLGIGDVLDEVVKYFFNILEEEDEDIIKFSLIGCLNVGKLLLINVIFGEDCVIVLDIEGIMWDVIDMYFEFEEG